MRIKILALSAASGLLLAGCATTDVRTDEQLAYQPTKSERYVAAVNREARRRGVRVTWVNPPTTDDRYRSPRDREN